MCARRARKNARKRWRRGFDPRKGCFDEDLPRRLDEAKERVARLERNVKFLVAKLDAMGHGDDEDVRKCAWSVGWFRSPEVARKVREAME